MPAHFLAGGEFPYPVVQGGSGWHGSDHHHPVQTLWSEAGVHGTIEDNGIIRLKVAPEVSSLDYTNAVTISGFSCRPSQTRRAETEIELKDGQSFGIAGLLDRPHDVQLSKVPGIGDIPILGQLFRSRSTNRSNTELIVLVTPTIVDPVTGPTASSGSHRSIMPVKNLDKSAFDKGFAGRD